MLLIIQKTDYMCLYQSNLAALSQLSLHFCHCDFDHKYNFV